MSCWGPRRTPQNPLRPLSPKSPSPEKKLSTPSLAFSPVNSACPHVQTIASAKGVIEEGVLSSVGHDHD